MNYAEEFKTAVVSLAETVINSPRLAAATGTTTGTLGVAMQQDWVQGTLANLAVLASIIMTALLGRLHYVKVKNEQVTNKILLRQLEQMGAEPLTEKTHDT